MTEPNTPFRKQTVLCNLRCLKARLRLLFNELSTAQQPEPCFNTALVMKHFVFGMAYYLPRYSPDIDIIEVNESLTLMLHLGSNLGQVIFTVY